jgi:hypothetical protein
MPTMAILVLGKCSANFGRQILGKALQFPGKRLQISLPECFVTLDTDFVTLDTKWRNACMICLFGDFNVYGSPLSNNIHLSHSITPTDVIGQMQ